MAARSASKVRANHMRQACVTAALQIPAPWYGSQHHVARDTHCALINGEHHVSKRTSDTASIQHTT
jgi:hypothetical protein